MAAEARALARRQGERGGLAEEVREQRRDLGVKGEGRGAEQSRSDDDSDSMTYNVSQDDLKEGVDENYKVNPVQNPSEKVQMNRDEPSTKLACFSKENSLYKNMANAGGKPAR